MTRNTLADLNDHLFAQLERLGEEGLSEEAIRAEVERARAVTMVAKQVIANADTVLRTVELKDRMLGDQEIPRMLGGAR